MIYDNQSKDMIAALNSNSKWKFAGSATGLNYVSLQNIEYNEIALHVVSNYDNVDAKQGWYDSSLVIPKVVFQNQITISMPCFHANSDDYLYCVCFHDRGSERVRIRNHQIVSTVLHESSTLYVYYR